MPARYYGHIFLHVIARPRVALHGYVFFSSVVYTCTQCVIHSAGGRACGNQSRRCAYHLKGIYIAGAAISRVVYAAGGRDHSYLHTIRIYLYRHRQVDVWLRDIFNTVVVGIIIKLQCQRIAE